MSKRLTQQMRPAGVPASLWDLTAHGRYHRYWATRLPTVATAQLLKAFSAWGSDHSGAERVSHAAFAQVRALFPEAADLLAFDRAGALGNYYSALMVEAAQRRAAMVEAIAI